MKVGDIVELVTGGLQMLVIDIDSFNDNEYAMCFWYADNGIGQTQTFRSELLEVQ